MVGRLRPFNQIRLRVGPQPFIPSHSLCTMVGVQRYVGWKFGNTRYCGGHRGRPFPSARGAVRSARGLGCASSEEEAKHEHGGHESGRALAVARPRGHAYNTIPVRLPLMIRLSRILASWTICLSCTFCESSSESVCTVLCALPQAFTVTVTSSVSGAPVAGAYVSRDSYGPGDGNRCNQALQSTCCDQAPGSTCYLRGFAGQYSLVIGAPGFQSVQRSITVAPGSGGRCCPGTIPGHLDVALVPAPPGSHDQASLSPGPRSPVASGPARVAALVTCRRRPTSA